MPPVADPPPDPDPIPDPLPAPSPLADPLPEPFPLPDPLPLRAHNVLCLLGFRGRGYSEAFVRQMAAVHQGLQAHPEHRIRLLAHPGTLCGACPHDDRGCTLAGPEHERHMRAQDLEVLRRLGLEEGATHPYREVLARIGEQIHPAHLPAICTTCPWLALGWCAEGLKDVEGLGSA